MAIPRLYTHKVMLPVVQMCLGTMQCELDKEAFDWVAVGPRLWEVSAHPV